MEDLLHQSAVVSTKRRRRCLLGRALLGVRRRRQNLSHLLSSASRSCGTAANVRVSSKVSAASIIDSGASRDMHSNPAHLKQFVAAHRLVMRLMQEVSEGTGRICWREKRKSLEESTLAANARRPVALAHAQSVQNYSFLHCFFFSFYRRRLHLLVCGFRATFGRHGKT